jgi:hypothetical protein
MPSRPRGSDIAQFQTRSSPVLDGLRAMNKNFSGDTGILLAKGRFSHGQQQIHGGLAVINRSDGYGWDSDDFIDWFENDIRNYEQEIQGM